MNALSQFHFLRPEWLWLLLPALLIWWLLWQRNNQPPSWQRTIAPHLLPHLLINSAQTRQRIRPVSLIGWIWLLGILALSGPTWQRETSPFAEEQSVLVVILKMTPSMLAGDLQPSRLVRATAKIEQLLALRVDTRTALIAYAGSAHRVIPFTRDHSLIVDFARALLPEVMPRQGNDLPQAIALGRQLISQSERPGTLVVMADSIDPAQLPELESARSGALQAELWAMSAGPEVMPLPGTPPAAALDEENMRAAAKALGGQLQLISVDNDDAKAINRRLAQQLVNITDQRGVRWRDTGYYLLPLLVLLSLFWFRRGWVVRWSD